MTSSKVEKAQEQAPGQIFDCAIVGGGPAGLSAAIYMGRMKRTVMVIDSQKGRSTWQQINRNYLGFPDGIHATSLREIGEEQAGRYGVQFMDAFASNAVIDEEQGERRFTIETDAGNVVARTVILATGVSDMFPEFPGSDECIGKSMFWCIICDGYEAIGKRIVVLGSGTKAADLASELLNFTTDVTLVSWDEPFRIAPGRRKTMAEHGITMHDARCTDFVCADTGYLCNIVLDNGVELGVDMLFVAQRIEPKSQLAKLFNVSVDENGFIVADSEQSTNIEGVFAAGDVSHMFNHQVTTAVHEGGMAAAAANHYLYADWQKE